MNLSNIFMKNNLKLTVSAFLLLHSLLLYGNNNLTEQNADSLFLNYIKKIDSTVIIKEEIIFDGNSFLLLSCINENDAKVRLKWMHLDDMYIVGILQNMFPVGQEITRRDTLTIIIIDILLSQKFHLITFNKKTSHLFIFYFAGNYDFSDWKCNEIVRVFDLILFSNIIVFDENYNYVGGFETPFIYLDRNAKFTKIFNQKKAEIFADKLDIYTHQQYKFFTRSGFRELLDILMYYVDEYQIKNEYFKDFLSTWKCIFRRKIESALQIPHKTQEKESNSDDENVEK